MNYRDEEDRLDWSENNLPPKRTDYRTLALLEAIAGSMVVGVILYLLIVAR